MPPMSLGFIIDGLNDNAERMAGHVYGCRVIQRLFEHCMPQQLEGMLGRFLNSIAKLARDNHGNYVVQSILEKGKKEDKRWIIDVIHKDFLDFAKNKVASNIVEKCFEIATIGADAEFLKEARGALFRKMLGDHGDPNSPLRQLLLDKFGNCTVQCVIKHIHGTERETLRERIITAEPELQGSTNVRQIIDILQKDINTPQDSNSTQALAQSSPSKGSALHLSGQCKPCAWFWKPQGCQNGKHCEHCHLCPEGELKERKKAKRAARR